MEKVGEFELLPKKEVAILKHEREKLEANLGGIKEMRDMPGVIFVVDSSKEHICIKEAKALNIPLVGLIDTNCDPTGIDYVIPGNDDAIRSVKLVAGAIADAVIEAREGVTVSKEEPAEEVEINMSDVLAEVKEEDKEKPKKKAKKSAKKAEKVEEEKVEEAPQEASSEEDKGE